MNAKKLESFTLLVCEAAGEVCHGNTDVSYGLDADRRVMVEFPTSPSVSIPLSVLYKNQHSIVAMVHSEVEKQRNLRNIWTKEEKEFRI